MTLLMWAFFIGGLILIGTSPWGLLPITISIGFLLSGGN